MPTLSSVKGQTMQFSLCFFAAAGSNTNQDKYRLLFESAKFADRNDFTAIWIPERHFHEFGGLYPNPSVIGAALASITENIQIRAGSVVLPLQDPLRVTEEWSVVDNLSKGRVALSFASGWHIDDFVLAPKNYENRREIMFDRIKTVQHLWQGHSIKLSNGAGNEVEVRALPKPLQSKLSIWITCQSDETFIRAGEMGANVITNLNYKSLDDLSQKIKIYRASLADNGYNSENGKVTLMIHTFMDNDINIVHQKVDPAYGDYIAANIELQQKYASGIKEKNSITEDDKDFLKASAVERLYSTHGLVGTLKDCIHSINSFQEIGVNEVACLIDFGIDFDSVMKSLEHLNKLKALCNLQAMNKF